MQLNHNTYTVALNWQFECLLISKTQWDDSHQMNHYCRHPPGGTVSMADLH